MSWFWEFVFLFCSRAAAANNLSGSGGKGKNASAMLIIMIEPKLNKELKHLTKLVEATAIATQLFIRLALQKMAGYKKEDPRFCS